MSRSLAIKIIGLIYAILMVIAWNGGIYVWVVVIGFFGIMFALANVCAAIDKR